MKATPLLHDLLMAGQSIIASQEVAGSSDGRVVTASIEVVGKEFAVQIEECVPSGYHDRILRRDIKQFPDANDAICYLLSQTGLSAGDFEPFKRRLAD